MKIKKAIKKIFLIFFTIWVFGSFLFVPTIKAEQVDLDDSFFQTDLIIEPEIISFEDQKISIYFFDDRLCPVCKEAKDFVLSLEEDQPDLEIVIYPITDTQKLQEIAQKFGVENYNIMAPTLFIGNPSDQESISFFQFRDFTSRQKETILKAIKGQTIEEDCCLIKIPFLNIEIDISNLSLPFVTVILGSLDGFNICSIGALMLVLSIVLVLDSKKKIFFYGGLFIITAVVIYGTLVFVWGKLFEVLVGQLEILRIIVGLAALGGGFYFFKEFLRFLKYGPGCKASGSGLAQRATSKLKKAFEQPGRGIFLLAGSVMFFAAAITVVELPCSIGLPIAFTGILIENQVSLSAYIFYILVYLFFYMLIEIVIFIGAVLTKKIWFAGSRIITWVTFAGAMVLFYLAYHYLFH